MLGGRSHLVLPEQTAASAGAGRDQSAPLPLVPLLLVPPVPLLLVPPLVSPLVVPPEESPELAPAVEAPAVSPVVPPLP
jgi:hypothetical protein